MTQSFMLVAWIAKATALLLVAAGLTLALRRAPAGARYVVWLATLATLLVIPAVSAWSPIPVRVLPPVAASSIAPAAPSAPAAIAEPTNTNVPSRTLAAPQTSARSSELRAAAPAWSVAQLLVAAWALVVVAILGWLLLGAATVRSIVRRAVVLDDDSWLHPMYDVADRLGLEHAPRVVMSDRIEMPFACGLATPTIVLPRSAEQWTDERRRVVLFHELAHVRRRDLLGHTLGRVACALYWFHPLVWSAAKRLRAESERACDDLVLACGGARASDYANHLLEIVTSIRVQGAPATALPMADRREFEGRMLAILDPAVTRATPSRRQTIALALGLGALSFTVAAVTPAAREAAASPTMLASGAGPVSDYTVSDTARDTHTSTITSSTTSRGTSVVTTTLVSPANRAGAAAPAPVAGPQPAAVVNPLPDADWKRAAGIGATGWTGRAREAGAIDTALLGRVLRTDKDAEVRKAAAWALQGHPEGVPLLLERIRVDSSDEVREMAAWALAQVQSPEVSAVLSSALRSDASSEVRATAAWALGGQSRADSAALVGAMKDASEEVRQRALWAIGQHHFEGVGTQVVALLKDPSGEVRLMAAWVLGELQDRSTMPALRDAFAAESNREVAQAEFRALAMMGDQSPELIDRALKSPDPEMRAQAVRMMAGSGARGWAWPWPWPQPRPQP